MNHVLCGLAANPALPPELVDRLIEIADEEVAMDLASREDLNAAQAAALVRRFEVTAVILAEAGLLVADGVDPVAQPLVALALLDAGAGRPEWARVLATSPVVEHREKLAECPGLPEDVVEALAADSNARVVAELALWTNSETAARLAGHPYAEVRSAVALNESTPPAVLAALISGTGLPPATRCLICDHEETPFTHDPNCPRTDCDLPGGASCDGSSHESTVHQMQMGALGNPATPAECAAAFADHWSMLLREQLAAREDLLPETYRELADAPVPFVRMAVAKNPAIGDALMRVMATDRTHGVQSSLACNPRVPLDVLAQLARVAKLGATVLPRIAAASPSEIRELAASPERGLRVLLAQRRDLPPEVRDALAADSDAKVTKSIASHPGLSEAQLRAMVDRHGKQVVAGVAANPDATPALLDHLARHEPPVRRAFREIARHSNATGRALLACLADSRARPVAAAHPALPPSAVAELLTDDDWQTVEAAAANPSLPLAVMSALVP